MFQCEGRQRVFNRVDVARQLSAWYSDAGGACLRGMLDVLMRDWLSGERGRFALEMSAFSGCRDWLGSGGFSSCFHAGSSGAADVITDFGALPIDTESLDLVIACHVLEFTPDPYRLLCEIDRVLTPRGRCVIISFNPFGFQGLVRPFKSSGEAPWCGRFYSLPRIRGWLSTLGFSVERSRWFFPSFARCRGSAGGAPLGGLFRVGSLTALYTCKEVSRMIPLKGRWNRQAFPGVKTAQPTVFRWPAR